jgi:nucleotide-binding universal stress UspA family protein
VPDYVPPQAKEKKSPHKLAQHVEQFREQLKIEANKMLIHAQAALIPEGINAEMRVVTGSPTRQLLALGIDYDLIVVGAHDQFARGKAGLGPVAERVVGQTLAATLVGRELNSERSFRVLAAVDGSLAGYHALRQALAWFKLESSDITLLHVTETPWFQLGDESYWQDRRNWKDWLAETEDTHALNEASLPLGSELRYEAEAVLNRAHRILEQNGLGATDLIEEGDPALEILSEAERGGYDMIVLGAAGTPDDKHDLKHELLGSVSAKVARDAPCSVFIARFIE